MYATKRRRRNVKNYKHPPKESQKSNPSKRHRERLNAELENLASLLPFEQNILTKLDKLSILRLAVSYLRIKSYFQANLKGSIILQQSLQQQESERVRLANVQYQDSSFSEGNAIFDSLNGFILIVNENSEVFYASRTVEQFIGFHQSDIIHQCVFELIHSEDREEFKKHLQWNSMLPPEKAHLTLNEVLSNKEYSKYLERNFTVRFRCLLDNTSGFLTLDIVGRLSVLHGQRGAFQVDSNGDIINPSVKTYGKGKSSKLTNNVGGGDNMAYSSSLNENAEPVLALFGIACPFGPSSLFELPQRDSLFKTKHRVNLSPISLDPKGKLLLGYSDAEYSQFSGYDLIHHDDLKYYANAHKELLKTGSSGLICYRVKTIKDEWQWLQSSMRVIYKSNKPECTLANHRPLTTEEGEELFYKRGFEFKLPYQCLYDFDSNILGANTTVNNSNINENQVQSSLSSILNNNSSNSVKQASNKQSSQSLKTQSSSSSSSTSKTSQKNPNKTKSSKQSKAQLIQQRAQQHAQQQLQLQQQQQQQQRLIQSSNYNLDDQSIQGYSYSNYGKMSSTDHLDYYQVSCKSELIDDQNQYDSTQKLSHSSSDYPTLSTSSASSCSSISSNLLGGCTPEGISINISNQCYPYGSYFNAMNQYTNNYSESSKFYNNGSYAPGFYSNNSYNYGHYNHFTAQNLQVTDSTTTGNSILPISHSNNSSCSSTSSTSSSSLNNGYSESSNHTIWPSDQMDTSTGIYPNSLPHNPLYPGCTGSEEFQYGVKHDGSNYNEILANNAAAIAASYSCATAAASTYGAYSFNNEDYKPAISQIPL